MIRSELYATYLEQDITQSLLRNLDQYSFFRATGAGYNV